MEAPAERPLDLGSILSDSARIWRRDFRSLTILAAGLELPLVIADIVLHITPGLKTLADDSVTINGVVILVFLYGSLSHHFLAGLLERVVASERHGHHRPTLNEVLRDLPWGRLVVADLLLTAMIVVGLTAFVIPGLLVVTWFAIVLPLVNLERQPVLPTFARSYRLVRGHSWKVAFVALSSFAIPELIIGSAAAFVHEITHDVVTNAIAHAIPAIILLPIAALPIVILAFELVAIDAAERASSS
jgi:hypothetical protein